MGLNKDGNSIESVKIVTRTETLEVKAKAFIDCTGDATLCALSGEETALYGRKIKNLTVAGRCVSVVGDKTWDITRVIPVCAVTGEAAGVIAAELAETCDINIEKVQETLKKRDIKLHLSECDL